ncbi:MAG: ABC transporter ATP-binding protein [Nitrospirota bacterium]|nr:ABC transporter ATP-binding protein [Nitrospirota bacterium]
MAAILDARNLTVQRGESFALNVPEIEIEDGEVLALIGPNGSGKSTLLQALALLLPPLSGEIVFEGRRIGPATGQQELISLRRRMAVVFQEPLLFDTTVFENIASGLKIRGLGKKEIAQRIAPWLDQLGIAHLAECSAKKLSGGEAQRVSLARALVLEPRILFLDEPFAALDAPTREKLTDDLEAIFKKTKLTTLFVTHDRNEALRLGDRIGVMFGGRLRQIGAPEEVFGSPVDEETARFVGVENILHGTVVSCDEGLSHVSVRGADVQVAEVLPEGEHCLICIRPEDVTLSRPDEAKKTSSARNRLAGVVQNIVPMGTLSRVTLQCGSCGISLSALITRQSLRELSLKEGEPVVASFKATAAHAIRK